MALNTIEELIEDIRQGKMVILMDDEDRENEGDLVMAAELVRPEDINFMARHARGLICLTLTRERCERLGLPPMVSQNGAAHQTNFTVSIEAAEGVTTGISAADRARTVQVAAGRNAQPSDIVMPGHIFPLMAQPGGVLSRAGHTEAGCDLTRLAGLEPAAVIVEIMNDDGTMARRPDLEKFAQEHGLKIGTIADLIHYRTLNERTVEKQNEETLITEHGTFTLTRFRDTVHGGLHLAAHMGEITPDSPTLVRVHFTDVLRDLFGACKPDSGGWPVQRAMARIAEEGKGVVVLLDAERGVTDLDDQLDRHFNKSRKPQVGGGASGAYVTVGTGSQILRELGVGKMVVMGSPMKFSAISGFDLEIVDYLPYCCPQPGQKTDEIGE